MTAKSKQNIGDEYPFIVVGCGDRQWYALNGITGDQYPIRSSYKEALADIDKAKFPGTAFNPPKIESEPILVNIGLEAPSARTGTLSVFRAIQVLQAQGVTVLNHAVYLSDSEPTLVAQLDRKLDHVGAFVASARLEQDCIAQYADGAGELYGPNAAAWGPFNPAYFITLSGKRLLDLK